MVIQGIDISNNNGGINWSAVAASGFPGMRPGSFAIPWRYGRPQSMIDGAQVLLPPAVAPTPPVDTRWADFETWWKPDTDYLDGAHDPDFLAGMGVAATAWAKYLAGKVSITPTMAPPLKGAA